MQLRQGCGPDTLTLPPTIALPEETRHFFVQRMNGETDEVTPATGISITPDRVYVLLSERPIAVYNRDDVYFIARELAPAPPLG